MRDRPGTLDHYVAALGALGFRLGFAIIGWSFGHDLAYALTAPIDGAALESTHGYLDTTLLGGQVALLLGFALLLRGILRVGTFGAWLEESSRRTLVATATLVPVVAFLSMEFGERAIAGVKVVPDVRLLVVGVIVQALIGLLVLGVVRWTLRTTPRVVAALRRAPESIVREAPTFVVHARLVDLASIVAARSSRHRGPPVPVN